MVKAGASLDAILTAHPKQWHKLNNIKQLQSQFAKKRRSDDPPPKCFLYHGESGAGKTRAVYAHAKQMWEADPEKWKARGYTHFDDLVFSKMAGSKWLDGYDGQPIILLDDFNSKYTGESEKATLAFLQRLLDRYQCTAEIKGSTVQINSDYIFITSNQNYTEWFSEGMMGQCNQWLASIKRRFIHEDGTSGIKRFTRAGTMFFMPPVGAQGTQEEVIDLTQDEPDQPFFD